MPDGDDRSSGWSRPFFWSEIVTPASDDMHRRCGSETSNFIGNRHISQIFFFRFEKKTETLLDPLSSFPFFALDAGMRVSLSFLSFNLCSVESIRNFFMSHFLSDKHLMRERYFWNLSRSHYSQVIRQPCRTCQHRPGNPAAPGEDGITPVSSDNTFSESKIKRHF